MDEAGGRRRKWAGRKEGRMMIRRRKKCSRDECGKRRRKAA